MLRGSVFLQQHVFGAFFLQNRQEEFLQHIYVRYASHSAFGKEEMSEYFLFEKRTKHVQFCTVASPNSHVMSINISR
jgi:hypothetical protein